MRIAMLYAPPWKLAAPGEPEDERDGPPEGYRPGDLDADFHQTPYGLLTLAAGALRAGHEVKVLNLSAFAWTEVERVLAELEAEVYGLSCWTANRRGVALVATELRRLRPHAHIVVGGPHATPFATEMLKHIPAIDTVCVGESDETFQELLERLAAGESTLGLTGTAYRGEDGPVLGPTRVNLRGMDELPMPQQHYPTHILMTSRGCAWACTFCGASTTWGRGFRANTPEYTLRQIQLALRQLPVKMLMVKDDTFTTQRKRVLELCRLLREQQVSFLWSCDTRVDVLGEELLREMRLAGCQRLSLGVESGSPVVLRNIAKKITPEEILESTRLAKRYGIRVRFYMMLGNRGETADTFRETLEFLERAAPDEYLFSCLSVYPGTPDYHAAEQAGWLSPERYFTENFQELKVPFDATAEDTALMNAWFAEHSGLQRGYEPSVEDRRATLALLGEHHAAYLDLAVTLLRQPELTEQAVAEAEAQARRALELGYPCPGLVYNTLAYCAWWRGDLAAMKAHFLTAARLDPQHWVLIQNVQRAREWFARRGPELGLPLRLEVSSDFQLLERTAQPTLPGPLPEGWAAWETPLTPAPAAERPLRTPEREGSHAKLKPSLKILR